MTRLTRTDSQARTREALLVAAEALFLRDGYVATSLERIAAEAGYSKGAVYSNFGTKDDLCLVVLDRVREGQARAMLDELATASSPAEVVDGFRRWAERHLGDEPWTVLEVEFATAARTNERLREQIARRRGDIVATIAAFVADQAQSRGLALPLPAEEVAVMGLSLGIGLGVQRAIDPGVEVAPLAALLALVLGVPPDRPAPH